MGKPKGRDLVKVQKLPALPPSPPPPPPRPTWSSYTRREIDRFWRKKRLVEEEHLLAAIKAAARLRASRFSEQDYKLFLEFLEENSTHGHDEEKECENNQEIRVGIKDWWTKSKYAYLNQPAVGTTIRPSRRLNYVPNNMFFCNYKLLPSLVAATPSVKAPCLGVY